MQGKPFRHSSILGLIGLFVIFVGAAACSLGDRDLNELMVALGEATPTPPPIDGEMMEAILTRSGQDASKPIFWQGSPPTRFNEAPMLAKMVKQRRLPPLEQRLPLRPLVIDPVDDIGKYGGVYHFLNFPPLTPPTIWDGLTHLSRDEKKIMPNVAESWEITNGFRSFTFHLREGMRWSDGAPFTSDDYEFAWLTFLSNRDALPSPPTWYTADGKLAQFEKVGTYSIKYTFSQPDPQFTEYTAIDAGGHQLGPILGWATAYLPRHFLKDISPATTSQANVDKAIREAGVLNLRRLYDLTAIWWESPGSPVIGPMITDRRNPLFIRTKRNPYYWVVDRAGNQLPYVDQWAGQEVSTTIPLISPVLQANQMHLRMIAGEFDASWFGVGDENLSMFLLNQKKGGYRVVLRRQEWTVTLFFNLTHGMSGTSGIPEMGKWLRNLDFRRAIALAIDGEEMNQTVKGGRGIVRAAVPVFTSSYYPGGEYETKNAAYDPDEANRLLDSIGLDRRDSEGFRIDPATGSRLVLSLTPTGVDPTGSIEQLIVEHLGNL